NQIRTNERGVADRHALAVIEQAGYWSSRLAGQRVNRKLLRLVHLVVVGQTSAPIESMLAVAVEVEIQAGNIVMLLTVIGAAKRRPLVLNPASIPVAPKLGSFPRG